MLQRLCSHWVYGGALAALLMLALSPLLLAGRPAPWAASFLLLPAYMLHQYEEHDDDRFRRFFNRTIGQGHEVLTPPAVFVVNVPVVWGVLAASLYASAAFGPGWALIAVYLVLVNALVHVLHALAYRGYNPGLATAVLVFMPLGAATLLLIDHAGAGTASAHALGIGIAVAIHASIGLHVRRRLTRLRGARAEPGP